MTIADQILAAVAGRQTGLAMMLGNAHLAMHMGPDEEMAQPLHEPIVLSVCETCAVERDLPVAALAEIRGTEVKR